MLKDPLTPIKIPFQAIRSRIIQIRDVPFRGVCIVCGRTWPVGLPPLDKTFFYTQNSDLSPQLYVIRTG